MCERAGLLIGWDYGSKRALVARANCDQWDCPECAERMADRWKLRAQIGVRAMLAAGETVDFVTITSHEKLTSFEATEAVWRHAWAMLYNAVKRRKDDLKYFIVPEKHKDGRMHIHIIWNAGVTKRWLKDNARRRGLGYQVDVSHVTTWGSAVKYVTKYLSKNLGQEMPKRFRRVRVSQNWPDVPPPNTPASALKWEYITSNRALWVVLAECQEKRISIIDQKTGEYFDAGDVDLDAHNK